MANLNKDEFGQVVYSPDFGEDISSASSVNFILEPQEGAKLERSTTDGVAIGSSNITVGDTLLLANQYLTYTILSGDLTYAGLWRIKGEASLSAINKIITNYKTINVNE